MQGSHVQHFAEQSHVGERITLVTSFICDDPTVFDTSCPRIQFEYSRPATILYQYIDHALNRLQANVFTLQPFGAPCQDGVAAQTIKVLLAEMTKLQDSWVPEVGKRYHKGQFQKTEDPTAAYLELRQVAAMLGDAKREYLAKPNVPLLAERIDSALQMRAQRDRHQCAVPSQAFADTVANSPAAVANCQGIHPRVFT